MSVNAVCLRGPIPNLSMCLRRERFKVKRINTRRYSTLVMNMVSRCDWTNKKFVEYAVCVVPLPRNDNAPITERVSFPIPKPMIVDKPHSFCGSSVTPKRSFDAIQQND